MYDFLAADGQLLNVSRKQQRPSTAGIWVLRSVGQKPDKFRCTLKPAGGGKRPPTGDRRIAAVHRFRLDGSLGSIAPVHLF
jgi:hypothetical protein